MGPCSRMVDSGLATDVDKLKLRQQIAFHGLIQRGVKGIQTETARSLAVFRIPRDGNAAVVRQVIDEYGGDAALSGVSTAAAQALRVAGASRRRARPSHRSRLRAPSRATQSPPLSPALRARAPALGRL